MRSPATAAAAVCGALLVAAPLAAAERYAVRTHQYQLRDAARDRPVWIDVWSPEPDAAAPATFPVIVMSHGAMGSARGHSRLATELAARGFVVAGVSHYHESWIYGPATIDRAAVLRLWDRPPDLSFALDSLPNIAELAPVLDMARVAALGHSSGGNTVIALGGARLDRGALMAYCRTDAATQDRGCDYAAAATVVAETPPEASASYRDPRVRAIVAFDPTAGPGYSKESLADVTVPVLIVGAARNDFLPFDQHAKRYADNLPSATLITLDSGEGHFVFLDPCTLELEANGVPLCKDRPGVDRAAVQDRLADDVVAFLGRTIPPSTGRKQP